VQCVIFAGDPVIFATHDDAQDLTDAYPAVDITGPDGGAMHRPAPEIVRFANTQRYATDELGRLLDPRQVPPPA
jgi:hypothetical protein